jgi:outer membrane protein assembly factor BamB
MSTLIRSIRDEVLMLRLVGLIVGCLSVLTVHSDGQQKPHKPSGDPTAHQVQTGEPKPRWTVPVAAYDIPMATSDALIAKLSDTDGVAVLDRTNGRTLWQVRGQSRDKSGQGLRTFDEKSVTFVGITTTPRQPQVAVLLIYRNHHVHSEIDYSYHKDERQAELVGRELRTGRQLWHAALPTGDPQFETQDSDQYNHLIWHPLDVYGEIIILRQRDSWTDARFMNARSGTVLNRALRRDLAVLQASAALHNKRHLHWETLRDGWPIRLDPIGRTPMALTSVVLDKGGGAPLGRLGNRFIWLSLGDDGETGHSSLPNYIVCFDVNGNEIWRFPKEITDTTNLGAPEIQLKMLDAGIMDPLGRAVLAQDYRGWIYALNVKTGKPFGTPLSKNPNYYVSHLRPYRRGYLGYDHSAGQLRYLDGRTVRPIKTVPLRLGKNARLLYTGSDIVFSVEKGKQGQLICYPEKTLLGTKPNRALCRSVRADYAEHGITAR